MKKRFWILTGAPQYFTSLLNVGHFKKAKENNKADFKVINLHEFTKDKYGSIDDYPYGGGEGMVMKPTPIFEALEAIGRKGKFVVLPSPKGEILDQNLVNQLFKRDELVFICGRYKGIDERVKTFVDMEISLGDFVISSGELATLVILEAIIRLIPGVVGNLESVVSDSFVSGLLSPPLYTRPKDFRAMRVPEVLLSGNHKAIEEWRLRESLRETLKKRPYLLSKIVLTEKIVKILEEIYYE